MEEKTEKNGVLPCPRSACCSCPIRVISAPSESFLLCDACGNECSLLTVEQAEQEYEEAPEMPLPAAEADRIVDLVMRYERLEKDALDGTDYLKREVARLETLVEVQRGAHQTAESQLLQQIAALEDRWEKLKKLSEDTSNQQQLDRTERLAYRGVVLAMMEMEGK